jgi:hypothetical protein
VLKDYVEDHGNLELCKDRQSAETTLAQIKNVFYYKESENWIKTCPLPCQQTVYTAKMTQFHKVKGLPQFKWLFSKKLAKPDDLKLQFINCFLLFGSALIKNGVWNLNQNAVIEFYNKVSKDVANNVVVLQYGFESLIVEEREESLVYDIGSFLAAGNNLLFHFGKVKNFLEQSKYCLLANG